MKERSYHVVEASEQSNVGETHQLRIVNPKTDEKKTVIIYYMTIVEYLST